MQDLSFDGIVFTKGGEGFESAPYLDSGDVPTIGFGSTYYEDGTKVRMTDAPITMERAATLFSVTMRIYVNAVRAAIKTPLKQYQFDALVSLCYNIGVAAFSSSTLVKVINAGQDEDAITFQFMRWNKDNGKVVKGLTNRRAKEVKLYHKGIYHD
jgi:lysozyme